MFRKQNLSSRVLSIVATVLIIGMLSTVSIGAVQAQASTENVESVSLSCTEERFSNDQVSVGFADEAKGGFAHTIEFNDRLISSGDTSVYVFENGDEKIGSFNLKESSIIEHQIDDRQACTYRTIEEGGEAGNEDSLKLITETQIQASNQAVVVNMTFVNIGEQTTTYRLPSGFIEDGFRLFNNQLADKSEADGEYRFAAFDNEPAIFEQTSYWSKYGASGNDNSVTVYNNKNAQTVAMLDGRTDVASAMTEDDDSPRKNSDKITYDVEPVTLSSGESGSWKFTIIPHNGGDNAPDRGSSLVESATYDFTIEKNDTDDGNNGGDRVGGDVDQTVNIEGSSITVTTGGANSISVSELPNNVNVPEASDGGTYNSEEGSILYTDFGSGLPETVSFTLVPGDSYAVGDTIKFKAGGEPKSIKITQSSVPEPVSDQVDSAQYSAVAGGDNELSAPDLSGGINEWANSGSINGADIGAPELSALINYWANN